ncbi:MAG TPA: FAD-dependent monooxygenase [Pseudonocardiaceae bacterium]|jgi:2-polyprenyl-6-methoxyphenol hydroxylase-like FAD-dependent oxidoreductase|nr:FAD-dependent monooxygenase [Pseudonocardiaceae bacterium]
MNEHDYDVIVAGAGPVGLALAGELALHGVRTLVIERLAEPSTTVKAGAINVPTAEAAYRRGLLPAMAEVQRQTQEVMARFFADRGLPNSAVPNPTGKPAEQPAEKPAEQPADEAAEQPADKADKAAEQPAGEPAERPAGKSADQPADQPAGKPAVKPAAAKPAPKMLGHFAGIWELDAGKLDLSDPDLEPSPASSVVLVNQQAIEWIFADWAQRNGAELRRGVELVGFTDNGDGVTVELADGGSIGAGWLVGCDGGRSLVRKLAGFDFPGTEPTITGHQAVVDIADPEKLPVGWNRTATGMLVFGPGPGRILTVEYDGPPADRDTPITQEELQASLRNVSGTDVTITGVRSATRFTDHARQVTEYRRGRVMLAGDAAHVHSPFGGQGLNLGVGDAVNLGWKLAATVNGWAPEGLLDTYTTERHPVGAWVLDWNRAQVALMRPDVQTGALRAVVSDLMGTGDGTTYFMKKLSGLWISYDLGGRHELVGKRTPDLEFADGTRLGEHCQDGRPLLVDLADSGLAARASGWSDRVNVLTASCPNRPELAGLLVRPDGYVAWAAERGLDTTDTTLDEALTRWFGAPVAVPAPVG